MNNLSRLVGNELRIILFTGVVICQDIDVSSPYTEASVSASIGTVTINGNIYNQFSLRPEIYFNKLGIGLDIYIYYSDNGLYWRIWDFSNSKAAYRTIVDKLFYLRWGHPGDNLYVMAGSLTSVTLGQGILVNNYSNVMNYPQARQIGLNFIGRLPRLKIELIHSDFKSIAPGLIGIHGSYEVSQKVNIGLSYVVDFDQFSGLPDTDLDNYPDYYDYYPTDSQKHDDAIQWRQDILDYDGNEFDEGKFLDWYNNSQYYNHYDPANTESDPVSGISIDLIYSLNNEIRFFSQFGLLIGEIDTFTNNITLDDSKLGWGLVPIGTVVKLGPLSLIAEYRIGRRRFMFSYWDQAYDIDRVTVNSSGIITKESNLYHYGNMTGFYIHTNMNLMEMVNLSMGYQNMQGEKWDNRKEQYISGSTNQAFVSRISLNPSIIPKVGKLDIFYQQRNVPNPFIFSPNISTILGYDFGIELSSTIMMVYKKRLTYIVDLTQKEQYVPVETIQLETQIIF